MKEQQTKIKIFNFSHPLMVTEGLSLIGNKYAKTLPFEWSFTSDFAEAQIIVWDGFVNPKNEKIIMTKIANLTASQVLLIMGESITLFNNHPILKKADFKSVKYVSLPGWNVLPEEILLAFEECYKKISNV